MAKLFFGLSLGRVRVAATALGAELHPWAWLVWGRELTGLELDTTGGPSWKSLPVAFAALVAPLSNLYEGAPAARWTAVTRAGALLALALAFRLALRLAGGRPSTRLLAGFTAAAALALTPAWIRYAAHGSEAPLAAALSLWAVERHLDGRRDHACLLGALGSWDVFTSRSPHFHVPVGGGRIHQSRVVTR